MILEEEGKMINSRATTSTELTQIIVHLIFKKKKTLKQKNKNDFSNFN